MPTTFKKILLQIFLTISFISWGQSDSLTTPVVNAQFPGGQKALIKHLMTNISSNVSLTDYGKPLEKIIVEFYVNESGKTSNVTIIKSSQNQSFDKQVVDAIFAMPLWTPAENKEGKKVRQLKTLPLYLCSK